MLSAKLQESDELIELYEQMLYQRAVKGIRPVLYVSSPQDLECNMLMLLDEPLDGLGLIQDQRATKRFGYDVVMN